jgi:hypothetical protein
MPLKLQTMESEEEEDQDQDDCVEVIYKGNEVVNNHQSLNYACTFLAILFILNS